MKHTEGTVSKVLNTVDFNENYHEENSLCDCYGPDEEANAERIAALWNAAGGMSSEEAVKALAHYEEMRKAVEDLMGRWW